MFLLRITVLLLTISVLGSVTSSASEQIFDYSEKRKYRSKPFEVSDFGLRLAYVQVFRRSKKKILHPPEFGVRHRERHAVYNSGFYEVLGVQKYGPAYVAGVLPGDHIYVPNENFHKRSPQAAYEKHARNFFSDVKAQLTGTKELPWEFQKLDRKRHTYKKSVAYFPENGPLKPLWEALLFNYFEGFEAQPWLLKDTKSKKKRRKKSRRSKKEQKDQQVDFVAVDGQNRLQYPLQGKYHIRTQWEDAQARKKNAAKYAKEEPIRRAVTDLTNFVRSKVALIEAGACKITDNEMATWQSTYDRFDQIIKTTDYSYSDVVTNSISLRYLDGPEREEMVRFWDENFYPLTYHLARIDVEVPSRGILRVKRDNACENEKNPLPDFEATVIAYLSGFANPCDGRGNGFKVPASVLKRVRDTIGRSEYSKFHDIGNFSRPSDMYGDLNERKRKYESRIEFSFRGKLNWEARNEDRRGKRSACFTDFIAASILD